MNNTCPLPHCGSKTDGKAVRGVNFCKGHRKAAVFIRDDPDLKKEEARLGRIFSGQEFTQIVIDVVNETYKLGFKVIET